MGRIEDCHMMICHMMAYAFVDVAPSADNAAQASAKVGAAR